MDPFLWQLLLMWAGRHAAWHCCGPWGPRARSRWRGEGKEEGVVVRTFMWDTSKHILVMYYSNSGNSVQMHWITSRQSGVCKSVTAAAAATVLDFSNFSEPLLPLLPHTNPASSLEFPPLSSLTTQYVMQTKVKCATNELCQASYKLGRSKDWLLSPFLICLDMTLKGLFKHGSGELGDSTHGGNSKREIFPCE